MVLRSYCPWIDTALAHFIRRGNSSIGLEIYFLPWLLIITTRASVNELHNTFSSVVEAPVHGV